MKKFDELLKTTKTLLGPNGCPWDKKQTHLSLIKNMREETEEAIAAIEKGDSENLREELGDVLLQVLFHANLAEKDGKFTIEDVCEELNAKLIRRHPHVFGNVKPAENEEEALARWREIKAQEKKNKAKK
ncbi:XTP/dITP diphosphohydrolase/tetrapyrrole methylase family protein / MazG family protein [Parelusimicrobium proximum]|uniref:MazG family protein n=1 Tax=Parelusimicrobium proximum TaxID=3228953 RepID=UPI003D176A8E